MWITNWTTPDGNCQFRAFGKAIKENDHRQLRARVVQHMKANYADFKEFYAPDPDMPGDPLDFDDYLAAMARDRFWGDHYTLRAMAEVFNVCVYVLKNEYGKRVWMQEHWGDVQKAKAVVWLHLTGGHYENLLTDAQVTTH